MEGEIDSGEDVVVVVVMVDSRILSPDLGITTVMGIMVQEVVRAEEEGEECVAVEDVIGSIDREAGVVVGVGIRDSVPGEDVVTMEDVSMTGGLIGCPGVVRLVPREGWAVDRGVRI